MTMVEDFYHALAFGGEAYISVRITGLVSQIYIARLREHGKGNISAVSEAMRRLT